jgi:uncharacterized OB-fold protein
MSTKRPDYGTCPTCGSLMLPVLALPPCGHDAPTTVTPLEGTGQVYSWTRAWSGEDSTLMAMADFFDGRLRVTAPVVGTEAIAIGDRVEAVIGDDTPVVLVVT